MAIPTSLPKVISLLEEDTADGEIAYGSRNRLYFHCPLAHRLLYNRLQKFLLPEVLQSLTIVDRAEKQRGVEALINGRPRDVGQVPKTTFRCENSKPFGESDSLYQIYGHGVPT